LIWVFEVDYKCIWVFGVDYGRIWVFGISRKGNMSVFECLEWNVGWFECFGLIGVDLSIWNIPKRKYDRFECLEYPKKEIWLITGCFEPYVLIWVFGVIRMDYRLIWVFGVLIQVYLSVWKCIQVFGIFQKGIMVDLSVWSGIRIDLSVWSWFWVFGIFNWCWLVLIVVDLSVWNIPKTVYEWCDRSENTLTVLNMIR
jgi:hypothetical protein